MPLTVGVGVTARATAADVEAVLAPLLAELAGPVAVLATVDTRGGHPAVTAVAARHGWPLVTFPAAALDAVPVPHPSATVRARTGTASVAEAAALLAAGPGARLVVPKRTGAGVTVAVARAGPAQPV